MLGKLFKKVKPPPERYVRVEDGKAVREDNPLPELFPALYKAASLDDFAQAETLRAEADKQARDFLFACHLPLDALPKVLDANQKLLLKIPPVYDLQAWLRGKKLRRLYESNLALGTLVQVMAFYGRSSMADRLRAEMMPALLAVSLRFLGARYLKPDELRLLTHQRKYDVDDPRQKDLRDQFLDRYRLVADKLAHNSADRFHQHFGEKNTCPPERYKALINIIRYSTRLMGRAAAKFKAEEAEQVHPLASYVAMLYNFTAAWSGTEKRAAQILAEEWSRTRAHARGKSVEVSAGYNMHALVDLFRVCRCQLLTNFQDRGRDAVYLIPDRVVVREVEDGGAWRWRLFKSKHAIEYRTPSLSEALSEKRITAADPPDEDLTPLA